MLRGKKFMKLNLGLLLCWIGIHRYKVIDISFGFGPAGSVKTVQCKICRIKKVKKDKISTKHKGTLQFV